MVWLFGIRLCFARGWGSPMEMQAREGMRFLSPPDLRNAPLDSCQKPCKLLQISAKAHQPLTFIGHTNLCIYHF